jgi:hypothetical protein
MRNTLPAWHGRRDLTPEENRKRLADAAERQQPSKPRVLRLDELRALLGDDDAALLQDELPNDETINVGEQNGE